MLSTPRASSPDVDSEFPVTVGNRMMRLEGTMIRRLSRGGYRLYSRKKNPRTGRRRNLGTFRTRAAAEKHERAVQFFKRH
jgi:hypothetical protein